MIRRRATRTAEADETPDYWITYSDLLVSLLVVFALLLFATLARAQKDVEWARNILRSTDRAVAIAADSMRGALRKDVASAFRFDSVTRVMQLNDQVLFDKDSSALKPEAREVVRALGTRYLAGLLQDSLVRDQIEAIVIEGHTDTTGSYFYNLDLSQRRALSVMVELGKATENAPYAAQLQRLVVASGRSEVEAIPDTGSYDAARARRIAIRIRFRNDALLERLTRTER